MKYIVMSCELKDEIFIIKEMNLKVELYLLGGSFV